MSQKPFVDRQFDDETLPDAEFEGDYECVCPPTPLPWTEVVLKSLTLFFSVEWILRVVMFCPIPINAAGKRKRAWEYFNDWFEYITSWPMVLDFLAIFPYYMELAFQTNGLMSLRLLRLFRVMQLVRLGQYNKTFMSLTAVLSESIIYLKLLVGVLLFAAAFFGSMIYWLEKGDWKYWPETQSYQFIRLNPKGVEEISPFKSIPDTFWWFFVTATVSVSTLLIAMFIPDHESDVLLCSMLLNRFPAAKSISVRPSATGIAFRRRHLVNGLHFLP